MFPTSLMSCSEVLSIIEGEADIVCLRRNAPDSEYRTSASGSRLQRNPLDSSIEATSPDDENSTSAPSAASAPATSSILVTCPRPDPKQPTYTLNFGIRFPVS